MRNTGIYPSFNANIISALKEKVNTTVEHSEICAVLFDEMSLKEEVVYNVEKDHVEGLEDFGCMGRTGHVANHVTVFMVRGLVASWKQPVCFFYSSELI